MEEIAKTIQCSNINCLVFNPHDNKFCHQCGTPIVRRYLYVLGEEIKSFNPGEIIGDRYIVQQANILLDSKPGLSPDLTEDLPPHIVSYLKLFPQRLHIPQVYGFTTIGEQQQIWLLEYFTTTTLEPLPKTPQLVEIWPGATPLRQLNWLWQMASLWQPLSDEGVAETLIKPSLIRVQGSIIKIRELYFKSKQKTPLKNLGHFWSSLVLTAHPTIKNLLKTISQAIIEQKIIDSKELLKILDQVISEYSKTKEYHYQICAYTDVGKIRKNNEDSCYPASGTYLKIEPKKNAFAIVCDGIGGHEGGEVASQMTIDFLQQELAKLVQSEEQLTPETLQGKLQQLTCEINDLLSDRNNTEQRFQQRQRMGTTLVMGFASNYEIYFTHVGDSRIYWITQNDCQQISVDDDLASRQVRLGYSLYRDALLYPGAGALIQALGMNPSISLFPITQRHLIDEDSVFLLCSDGLSDFDRIEQHWEKEILPILTEKKDLSEVGQRLIEIANQTNGHDNITIALIHCQITPKPNQEDLILNFENLIASVENLPIQEEILSHFDEPEEETELKIKPATHKTKQFASSKKKKGLSKIDIILTIFIILGSLYLINAWILEPLLKKILQPEISFKTGEILKTNDNILLYPDPSSENNPSSQDGVAEIIEGSILQILDINEEYSSLKLKVCKIYSNDNLASIPAGEHGWINRQTLVNKIDQQFTPDSVEEDWCNNAIKLKVGDVVKTTDNVIFPNNRQLPEITSDTLLKVIEITEDKTLVKFQICYANLPENNNKMLENQTNFISIQKIITKIDQANINNYSLENTICNNN